MGAYDCDCINNLEYDRRERKTQLSQKDTTSDLISRQAAIDAVKAYLTDCQIEDADWHGNGIECELENLPPAQPDVPDTNVGDTISRQQAIDALDCINGVEEVLRSLPSVQPKPHEGHWIRTDCGLDVECKCSECGYKDFVEPRDEYWFKRNYCPNCGAKMKGATT